MPAQPTKRKTRAAGEAAAWADFPGRGHREMGPSEREALLRHASSMARLGYWVWDVVADRCIFASEEFARIPGKTVEQITADTGLIDQLKDGIHADDVALYAAAITEGRARGEPYDIEFRLSQPDGTVRNVRELAEYLHDEDGRITRAVGTLQDITDHKRAQADLHAAKDAAEAASRAKSDFLARISHELRSPLHSIIGFSEILHDEIYGAHADARYREFAANITDAGSHLLSLIGDLLDLSKIEAGKYVLNETVFEVGGAIRAAVEMTEVSAREAGVTLDVDIGPGQLRLNADERAFRQMLINLLSNAVKFTPRGGRVSVRAALVTRGAMVVAVSDTGVGIAVDDMGKALDAFEQVEEAFPRQTTGTGLGLPITKSLVELHGGTLTLDSEVGTGTTVTLRFPPARVVS